MQLPNFEVYCENTTAVNALVFSIGNYYIYYSYKTPVAFRGPDGLKVSENCWGPTTGKHLNAIDGGDKANRMPRAEFEKALKDILCPSIK